MSGFQPRALSPKPGAKFRVIGAGLPRTGTSSLCAALGLLLDGPPYHAGAQWCFSTDESHILTLIDVLEQRPYHTEQDRQLALDKLGARLDGYVATSDPPLTQMIPELMQLYPDAKVICTTRDKESWCRSMMATNQTTRLRDYFRVIFFWIPSLRHMWRLIRLAGALFFEIYGRGARSEEDCRLVWDQHHRWIKEIVPKDKLFFIDVKDGWGPLCRALDMPIPKDIPFPQVNDGQFVDKVFRSLMIKGVWRWTLFFGATIGTAVALAMLWRTYP